jgi:hypothetical protein
MGGKIATKRTYLDHSAQIRSQDRHDYRAYNVPRAGCPPGLAVKRTADGSDGYYDDYQRRAQIVFRGSRPQIYFLAILNFFSNAGGMRKWAFYWFSQQSFFLHRLGGVSPVTPSVSADSTIEATASATRAAETPHHLLSIHLF